MNSGKIVAGRVDGRVDGEIEGSTRGPRGPKKWGLPNIQPAREANFKSAKVHNCIGNLAPF